MTDDDLRNEVAELRKTVEEQGIRITLAQAWVSLLNKAYDALLHYGVNYKKLRAYKDDDILDTARDLPASRGRDLYISWMGRVENAISAAIRRKGFRVH